MFKYKIKNCLLTHNIATAKSKEIIPFSINYSHIYMQIRYGKGSSQACN